jgi:hypothetical protein
MSEFDLKAQGVNEQFRMMDALRTQVKKVYTSDDPFMRFFLVIMAALIVWFNVLGYKELFNENLEFLGITPFGALIGFAEIAVLAWTSKVIANYPNTSRILKVFFPILILSFWFLCFTGINSYLKSATYSDVKKYEAAKSTSQNNKEFIGSLDRDLEFIQINLDAARKKLESDSIRSAEFQVQANTLTTQISDRRRLYLTCGDVPDCANTVASWELQLKNIQRQHDAIFDSNKAKREQILQYEIDISKRQIDKNKLEKENRDNLNVHAITESSFNVKKASYEHLINGVFEFFGAEKPNNPFDIFLIAISMIIYPVYLLLNFYVSLNSPLNLAVRKVNKERRDKIETEIQDQKDEKNKETRNLKVTIANEKRIVKHQKAMHSLKHKKTNHGKLLKYMRVWAKSRKKTLEVEVVKEVLVEVEVEKVVIEIVEQIVTKEVLVEIDKLIPVDKEVLIYVDRIKKIPEPVFITEPQIIIHERIVPVPEGISAVELQELLSSQSELNQEFKQNNETVLQ